MKRRPLCALSFVVVAILAVQPLYGQYQLPAQTPGGTGDSRGAVYYAPLPMGPTTLDSPYNLVAGYAPLPAGAPAPDTANLAAGAMPADPAMMPQGYPPGGPGMMPQGYPPMGPGMMPGPYMPGMESMSGDPSLDDGEPCPQHGKYYFPGTFEAGVVFMFREPHFSAPLATSYNDATDVVLDAHDVAPNLGTGIRFAGKIGTDALNLELLYFGVDNWSRSLTATGPSGAVQITDLDPTATVVFSSATATYVSQLHNGEVNLRSQVGEAVTALMGFRYCQMIDDLSLSGVTASGAIPYVDSRAENELFGFQIGADLALWKKVSPLSIDASIKGGVYSNQVSWQRTAVDSSGNTTIVVDHDGRASFIGEADLRLTYTLTPHVSLFGMYQAMWLTGVAVAPNGLSALVTTVDDTQTVFYHGATGGVEANW